MKGIKAMRFGLAPQTLASCTASPASDPAQRCIYPDAYNGTWNVSLIYASPTLITLPHFLQVRPAYSCISLLGACVAAATLHAVGIWQASELPTCSAFATNVYRILLAL